MGPILAHAATPNGPKPVRNKAHPHGFPWLEGAGKAEADKGNAMIDFTVRVASALHSHLATFLIEHPEDLGRTSTGHLPASIWQLPAVRALAQQTGARTIAFFQCDPECTGVELIPHPKPTRLLGTAAALADAPFLDWPTFDNKGGYLGPLPRSCGHVHRHDLRGRTKDTAHYPEAICCFLAKLVLSGAGDRPPEGPTTLPPAPLQDACMAERGPQGSIVGEGDFINKVESAQDPPPHTSCNSEGTSSEQAQPPPAESPGPVHQPVCSSGQLDFRGPVPLPQKQANEVTAAIAGIIPETGSGSGRALKFGLYLDQSGKPAVHQGHAGDVDLARALNALARKAVLRLGLPYQWSTLQLNLATASDWHVDLDFKAVLAFALGHYEGGEFEVQKEAFVNGGVRGAEGAEVEGGRGMDQQHPRRRRVIQSSSNMVLHLTLIIIL